MSDRIIKVSGHMILDSRGVPTVQARVETEYGAVGVAAVPSGASTGSFEAHEKRDGDESYFGKNVTGAIDSIRRDIHPLLQGMSVNAQWHIDRAMVEADGTPNKENFGANATLAVSLACARAAAVSQEVPLFRYIGGASSTVMPVPMMNILNGGAHASNGLDFQEFMIMPVGADSFSGALQAGAEIYHTLKNVLKERNLSTAVGDEGGFAPDLDNERQALQLIITAIESAGYRPGEDVVIALDAAASEWAEGDHYRMPKSDHVTTREELIELYRRLHSEFPIVSIEDPLCEDDFDGFRQITNHFAGRVQIVGDDLFVTNPKRLTQGILSASANAILIKPNQVGTLSETMETIRLAKRHGYNCIMSHRSGETEDTTIADLAVALNCGQIKTGAPCRSERVAKYNRLLRIESLLGDSAQYLGKAVLSK